MKPPPKPLTVRWESPALRQLADLLRTFHPPGTGAATPDAGDPGPAAHPPVFADQYTSAGAADPARSQLATAYTTLAAQLRSQLAIGAVDPRAAAALADVERALAERNAADNRHTIVYGTPGWGRTFWLATQDIGPLCDPVPDDLSDSPAKGATDESAQ